MLRRFIERMHEREGRRVFLAVLGGKAIAAVLLCGAIYGLSNFVGTAHAEEAAAAAPYINPINGGGFAQLRLQVIGSAAVTLATIGVALALMYAVKATGTLRVSQEGELMGLDLHEHGGFAYPEIMSPLGTIGSGQALRPPEEERAGVRVALKTS